MPILLGLGLHDLSVTAAAVPNIKALVRELDAAQIATRLTESFNSFRTAQDVREFSKKELGGKERD